MNLQWLLGWWNLIFIAPFAIALVYLFACTLSGVGMGDADADADAHVDADVDADADVDTDVDVDADVHTDIDVDSDADADVDADADADSAHDADGDAHDSEHTGQHTAAHTAFLAWLGVGRVPLSLIAIMLMLTWGAAGFVTNAILRPRTDWAAAAISIPAALVASLLIARSMVLLIARFVPLNQNLALRSGDLVGESGQALFGIDERFGLVAVRDPRGDLKQLPCRIAAGVEPIPRGARVRLVAYQPDTRVFFVRQVD